MPLFIKRILLQKLRIRSFVLSLLTFISIPAYSQTRAYSLVYSDNIKGGTAIFGNTLMNVVTDNIPDTSIMNDNRYDGYSFYGNDSSDMQYVDIDGNLGYGSVTRNSSSADLILPAGTNTIKLARLYWGGRVADSAFDLSQNVNRTIKIRKGTTGVYSDIIASGLDKATISNAGAFTEYQAYADITTFVKNNGAGTYEAGNVPLSTGIIANGGNNGGWGIVVVYENNTLSFNSIRVYDGFQQIYNGGYDTSSSVTLTGFDVPSEALGPEDAKMGALVWEGDANITGDFLKINGNTFSNATNPPDNPWNGTITDNGIHVNTKNPDYTNQMGIDIDMFDVGSGYGIAPNASTVNLQFGTVGDQYYPGVFTFTMKMKDSASLPVTLTKFDAELLQNNQVKIEWITSMEIRCSRFVVQRSYDGNIFTDIKTVPGTGTSNLIHFYSVNDDIYSFTDPVVYYRLKQIDLDGKENLSKIIALKIRKLNDSATVSPNPFTDHININLECSRSEIISIKIFNVEGKEIVSKQMAVNKGNNSLKINGLSNLAGGNYFLQIICSSKKIIKKITK